MQFVLTPYGANLFTTTGIPKSLTFVAGSAFGYAPVDTDTAIHGSIIASGIALMVNTTGSQPVFNVTISSVDFPDAVAFGELGLFFSGVLIALGSGVSSIPLLGKNVSLECVLPLTSGVLGPFSPVALAANAGNINVLPSVDVLPNANTATTYTQATGISNSYIIAETGLLAVSTGVHWDLVGGLFLTELSADAADFTSVYVQVGGSADEFLSQIPVPTTMYLTVTSGLNAGLARKVTFTGLERYSYSTGPAISYKFLTVAPWTGLFQVGDTLNAYVASPAIIKVNQGGLGPPGPPGLDSFVVGPTGPTGATGPAGPTGAALMDGLFVLDVTPIVAGGIVGSKVYPPSVPANRVVSSCTTDNAHVRITVGINGNAASYSPTVLIGMTQATITESATTRWFTAVADVTVGTGTTTVEVVSNTGSRTSVDVTLAGAGPNILSALLGAYPNSQTTLKAGDQITVTVTTEAGATEVQLLATGAAGASVPYPVTGTTATCLVTIGNAQGPQVLTFKAKNSFGTYGNTYPTVPLTLDQAVPTFGAITVSYPVGQGALNTSETATVSCTVSDQTSVAYTAVGLTVDTPSVYGVSKQVTLSSTGYVDSGTNYTITAQKASNGSSAVKTGLVNLATVAPAAAITTSPAGRMVGSPTGISYTVTVTSTQNLTSAPSLTASAGAWAGAWAGSGKVWTRALNITDSTPKGSALFSALAITNQALINGSVISSGSTYTVGGFSSRTITFPSFSRVAAIGTTVTDQTKTSCQIVAGNVLTRYSDNTVHSNGYYIANADGTYNAQGAYVALSDSAFAGSNTSGTLQVTLAETA
jgi:uncharacterized protein YfiM (DUF2279 family)